MSADADAQESAPLPERGFHELLEMLSTTYGFDFREYKEGSLARRIRTRMSQIRIDDFVTYGQHLAENPDEHVALFNTVLINVTGFFRDPEAWTILAEDVIPRIVANARDSRSIRVWSAGCSSGEEPFSVAMLLAEHLGERASEYHIKVYGTDIDEEALVTARQGLYRLEQIKDVPADLLDRYFTRDGQLYRFRRDLRRWCIFGAHNLTQAPPLSHIDLLLCRNVLIYFTSDLQGRILARFHYALREDGHLFLGRSESLLARSRLFSARHLKWRLFQRLPTTGRQASAVLPGRELEPGTGNAEPMGREAGAALGRAQQAIEAMPAAVMIIDMTDTVLTWNLAAEQLFDVPIGNAVARKFRDLDVSYRIEGLRARIEDVKARHAGVSMENVAFTRRDGTPVHADIAIRALTEGQRQIGVLVFAVEATEHARLREQMTRVAEQHATAIEELQSTNEELETTNEELQSTNEELETTVEELQAANTELAALNREMETRTAEQTQLEAQHRGIIDAIPQGVVTLDRGGIVRSWNSAAEQMWLVRSEHAVGSEFFSLPIPSIRQIPRPAIERVWSGSEFEEIDGLSYTTAAGQVGQATLRLTPIRDAAGAPINVLGILRPAGAPASS